VVTVGRKPASFFEDDFLSSRDLYKPVDQWIKTLGAVLVVNGSYFAPDHLPATPFLSGDRLLGPANYSATAGAFVSGPTSVDILDLAGTTWESTSMASNAPHMVNEKCALKAIESFSWRQYHASRRRYRSSLVCFQNKNCRLFF
jgi:hypothetical protein